MDLPGDNGSGEIGDRGAKLQSSYKCRDITTKLWISGSHIGPDRLLMIQNGSWHSALLLRSHLWRREQGRGFGEITHGIKLGPAKRKSLKIVSKNHRLVESGRCDLPVYLFWVLSFPSRGPIILVGSPFRAISELRSEPSWASHKIQRTTLCLNWIT